MHGMKDHRKRPESSRTGTAAGARALGAVAVSLALLVACGPVSPEAARRQCTERANAAVAPTGEVGIGITNRGRVSGGIEIGVSSDYLSGRDPEAVYRDCMIAKTGAPPTAPLVLREGLLR